MTADGDGSDEITSADLAFALRTAGCVFAEDEARLLIDAADSAAELRAMLARRTSGEPLEYVLGWVEFCGMRIAVDAGVFIPRRRTELLVHEAARLGEPGAVVLDMCCGTGAIGLVLAHRLGGCELHAADVDPATVRCARRNLEPVGGLVYEGDLSAALPGSLRGRVELLVANVPYVPSDAISSMPVEAREYEPLATHDGGPDGLDVLRRLLTDVPAWLTPGGHLFVEIYAGQADAARAAFCRAGLDVVLVGSDEYDTTIAIGTAPDGGHTPA